MDGSDRTSFKTFAQASSLSCAVIELSTYVVQANVGIQDVHEFAKRLVSVISGVNPRFVGVCVSDQLSKVYDTTQHVAEAVQILDDSLQLLARLGSPQYTAGE